MRIQDDIKKHKTDDDDDYNNSNNININNNNDGNNNNDVNNSESIYKLIVLFLHPFSHLKICTLMIKKL